MKKICPTLKLEILSKRGQDGWRCNLPTTSEVANLIVDDYDIPDFGKKISQLKPGLDICKEYQYLSFLIFLCSILWSSLKEKMDIEMTHFIVIHQGVVLLKGKKLP